MAEKVSQGQADKAAAEARTADVAAENKQNAAQQRRESEAALEGKPDDATAAERLTNAGPGAAMGVAVDPYPPYEAKSVAELRSAAKGRGVEINRDVEKSELVRLIRANDPGNAALDFMTLDDLRSLAGEKDVELGEEFEKAHLVTELRAADTGVSNSGQHVL
jgi:hypothetical protein